MGMRKMYLMMMLLMAVSFLNFGKVIGDNEDEYQWEKTFIVHDVNFEIRDDDTLRITGTLEKIKEDHKYKKIYIEFPCYGRYEDYDGKNIRNRYRISIPGKLKVGEKMDFDSTVDISDMRRKNIPKDGEFQRLTHCLLDLSSNIY